jgi:hypothetical protein
MYAIYAEDTDRREHKGGSRALEQLMPVVYGDLHRLAQRYMALELPEHTLQATAWYTRRTCGFWIRPAQAGRTKRTSLPCPGARRDITISAFLLTAFSGRRGDPESLPR